MRMRPKSTVITILTAISILVPICGVSRAQVSGTGPGSAPLVLRREEAATIMPPSVFFRGQSAPVQARNSAGLRLADGKLVLVAIVDTSGYSSALQQTYQAYLLTEVALTIGNQRLGPGAYGFGFVEGNTMTVMDVGGHEILRAGTTRDDSLARPNPLQIMPDPGTGASRLYLGKSYVTVGIAEK